MFSSWGTSGTDSSSTSTGQKNGEQPPSYNNLFPQGTPNQFKGNNKKQNNGQKGQKNKEEQSNFNSNEGVFSIPIIKEFSNLNTQNIEIAEQEGMIGCSIC
jgi:hypothetical protein